MQKTRNMTTSFSWGGIAVLLVFMLAGQADANGAFEATILPDDPAAFTTGEFKINAKGGKLKFSLDNVDFPTGTPGELVLTVTVNGGDTEDVVLDFEVQGGEDDDAGERSGSSSINEKVNGVLRDTLGLHNGDLISIVGLRVLIDGTPVASSFGVRFAGKQGAEQKFIPSCAVIGKPEFSQDLNVTGQWNTHVINRLPSTPTAFSFETSICPQQFGGPGPVDLNGPNFSGVTQRSCEAIVPMSIPVIMGTTIDYGATLTEPVILQLCGCGEVIFPIKTEYAHVVKSWRRSSEVQAIG